MIYFIQCTNGLINVGYSDRIERVMWSLRKLCPYQHEKFILLGKIDGTKKDLQEIYDIFKDLHSHREWYRSEPKLLTFIENMQEFGQN